MVWVWAAATISLEIQGQELLIFGLQINHASLALFGVGCDFVSRRSGDFDLFLVLLRKEVPLQTGLRFENQSTNFALVHLEST